MTRSGLVILVALAASLVCPAPSVADLANVAADTPEAGADVSPASQEPPGATGEPANESLALGRPNQPLLSASGEPGVAGASSGTSKSNWVLRTLGALGVVIVLMLVLRWMLKHAGRASGTLRSQLGAGGRAPSGVLFVLARYPVSRGMSLVLVRLHGRVLLLSQSSEGFRTLSELDDADEVAAIIRATEHAGGASARAGFDKVLRSLARDPSVIEEAAAPGRQRPAGAVEAKPSAGRRVDITDTDATRRGRDEGEAA